MAAVSADDKKAVEAALQQRGDKSIVVETFVKGKTTQLAVFGQKGRFYLLSTKKGVATIDFSAHLIDLRKIKSPGPNKFSATFGSGAVEGDCECTNLIHEMRKFFFHTFFETLPCEVDPDSRLRDLDDPPERPCGGFSDTYVSVCDYQGVPPRPDIIADIDNVFAAGKRKYLDLEEFESIKPPEFCAIVGALGYNKYFTGLSCSNQLFDKNMAQALGTMLTKNVALEELKLANASLVKGLIAPVADGLKGNKDLKIQILDVSDNQMGDKDLPLLGAGLGSMAKGLINLNVSNCGVKKNGMAGFVNAFKKNMFMSGSLHTLNMSNNTFDNDATGALSAFLAQPTGLQVLSLVNCSIKLDQLFAALVRGCQALEWIDISGNKIAKKDLGMMGQFFKAASHLRTVRMNNCGLDGADAKQVLTDMTSNMYLNDLEVTLAENRIGFAGAKLIYPVLQRAVGIKKIDLSEMDLGTDGIQVLCGALSETNKKLELLDISGNFVGKAGFELALEAVNKMINSECPVSTLLMRGGTNPLRDFIHVFFTGGLAKNDSVVTLDVSDNHFGARGAFALAKAIQSNKKLASLRWDGNDTPISSFEYFARCLSVNKTLKHMPLPVMDISNNMRTNQQQMEPVMNGLSALITRNSNPEIMGKVFMDAGGGGGGGGAENAFLFKGEATQLKNLRNKVKALGRKLEGVEQVVLEDSEVNDMGISDIYQQRESAMMAMKQDLNDKLKNLAFDILPVINEHMNKMQSSILSIVEKRYGSIDKEMRSRLRLNMQFGAKDVDPEEVGKILTEATAAQIIRKAEEAYSSAIGISSDYIYEKLMEGLQNVIDEVIVQAPPEIKEEPKKSALPSGSSFGSSSSVAEDYDSISYEEEPQPLKKVSSQTPISSPAPSTPTFPTSVPPSLTTSTSSPGLPASSSAPRPGPAVPPKPAGRQSGYAPALGAVPGPLTPTRTPAAAPAEPASPAAGAEGEGGPGSARGRGGPGPRGVRGAGPPRGGGIAARGAALFGAGGPPMPMGMGRGGPPIPRPRPVETSDDASDGVSPSAPAPVSKPVRPKPVVSSAPVAPPSGDHANLDKIEEVESNIDNSVLKNRVRGPPKRAPPSRRARPAE